MMSDTEFFPIEKKHTRKAWPWVVVIIAVGALCILDGLLVQVANQGATEAEALAYTP